MERNKVALFTLEFPPDRGGVSRMYGQMQDVLADNLDVYVNRPAGVVRNERVTYLPLIDERRKWKWYPAIVILKNIWKTGIYKKIIVGQVLPLGSSALLARMFSGLRYDVILHGMDISVPVKITRKRWLLKLILWRADKIICANKYVARFARQLAVPENKIVVIYPVPGITKPATNHLVNHLVEAYKMQGKPVLLTVSRLVERKGVQHILLALEEVWLEYPEVNYVVVGDGPYVLQIKSMIAKSSQPGNVHLLTNQNDDELSAWYQVADIFVFTPYTLPNGDQEGLGIVNIEAGAYAKPCIATRHGGVPEAVIHEKTGLLVAENNTREISQAIIKLIENPDLRLGLGLNGQQRVNEIFSKESMKEKLQALYVD